MGGHFQLCSLPALFLRVLTILPHPFKILCRTKGKGSLLFCIKSNVSILPFKAVMALSNWVATMSRVPRAKVEDSDKNMLWSKVGIAAKWHKTFKFLFSLVFVLVLTPRGPYRKKKKNSQDYALPAIKASAGRMESLFS